MKKIFALVLIICFLTASAQAETLMVIRIKDGAVVMQTGDVEQLFKPQPMGSTIKPLMALAALRSGWNPQTPVLCTPSTLAAPQQSRCWLAEGHGRVDLTEAVAQSCNVFFRHLVRNTSREKIESVIRDYKLAPAGSHAPIKDLEVNDLITSGKALPICPVNMLTGATAAFAGGKLFEYRNEGGKILLEKTWDAPPSPYGKLIAAGMRMGSRVGTSHLAGNAFPKLELFGKTGTAMTPEPESKSLGRFIGFSPYSNPTYAVVVVLDDGTGAEAAMKAARALDSLTKEK